MKPRETKPETVFRIIDKREARAAAMEAKYALKEMREELRAVVERHGLTVEDCDEYPASYSYGKTPEGYIVKLT